MSVIYLFRKEKDYIFETPEDPTTFYQWLCGHCEFPVELSDHYCWRCGYALGYCPICTPIHHRRPVSIQDKPGQTFSCSSCGLERVQLNEVSQQEAGFFCRNLYGCRAAGRPEDSDDIMLLPATTHLCPVCKHSDLKPLRIYRLFEHLEKCIFCSTLFERSPGKPKTWAESTRLLYQNVTNASHPCRICDRIDFLASDPDHKIALQLTFSTKNPNSIEYLDKGTYVRMVELAHALTCCSDATHTFDFLDKTWRFADPDPQGSNAGTSIADLYRYLESGTNPGAMKKILENRWNDLLPILQHEFREGAERKLAPVEEV